MLKSFLFYISVAVFAVMVIVNIVVIRNTILSQEENSTMIIEKLYNDGYKDGFRHAKEITHKEYQNLFYKVIEENYNKNDIRHQIVMEKRIEKIINKSNSKISDDRKNLYKEYIMKWSDEYELSPVFVASMIHRETNFNEKAVSKANARGSMQVIAKWHKEKLRALKISEKDLHSINHGVRVGCWVIRDYLDQSGWNYREALKRYVGAVNSSADKYINDIFNMAMYAYDEQ